MSNERRLMEMSRPEMEEAMQKILDVFSGADGGGSFAILCMLVQDLDKDAAAGDKDAIEVLSCITKFNKLIEIAKRGGKIT